MGGEKKDEGDFIRKFVFDVIERTGKQEGEEKKNGDKRKTQQRQRKAGREAKTNGRDG